MGLQIGTITINDDAGGSQSIPVSGNGVLSGGSLIFSPTSLTFSAEPVGSTSPAQSALLVNNGNQAVTLTNITVSPAFAQTNNCGVNFPTNPALLNVGQSCTISVSFTPSATGSTTGSVSITSNAAKGSVGLTLNGTGSPVFSLSANARSSIVLIGTTAAIFTVTASGPSSIFPGSINLACTNGVTCNFTPTAISPGVSSQLTVTGLSATSANPLNFTVTGTKGGNQVSSVGLTIFFADYSLTASPVGTTVAAGNAATYTISLASTNGFNAPVLLSCGAVPPNTKCFWNPPSLIPSGSGATIYSTLTLTTTTQSGIFRHRPPPLWPPGATRWMPLCILLALLGVIVTALSRSRFWRSRRLRWAILMAAFGLMALGVGCEDYVNPININPVVNGTPSGNYTIQVLGTLGTNNSVVRGTTVNVSVLPNT